MPFTPAHAAAALPFRRFARICWPALVIGTLTPDMEYFLWFRGISQWGHDPWGTLYFCLPLGLAMLAVWELVVKSPWALLLPASHRDRWWDAATTTIPARAWWTSAPLSILLGAWTHLLWDAFTHEESLGERLLPWIDDVAFRAGRQQVAWVDLFQHGSTLLGGAVLVIAYLRATARRTPHPDAVPHLGRGWRAVLATLWICLPLALGSLHAARRTAFTEPSDFVRGFAGSAARAGGTFAIVAGLLVAVVVVLVARERVAQSDP